MRRAAAQIHVRDIQILTENTSKKFQIEMRMTDCYKERYEAIFYFSCLTVPVKEMNEGERGRERATLSEHWPNPIRSTRTVVRALS